MKAGSRGRNTLYLNSIFLSAPVQMWSLNFFFLATESWHLSLSFILQRLLHSIPASKQNYCINTKISIVAQVLPSALMFNTFPGSQDPTLNIKHSPFCKSIKKTWQDTWLMILEHFQKEMRLNLLNGVTDQKKWYLQQAV